MTATVTGTGKAGSAVGEWMSTEAGIVVVVLPKFLCYAKHPDVFYLLFLLPGGLGRNAARKQIARAEWDLEPGFGGDFEPG